MNKRPSNEGMRLDATQGSPPLSTVTTASPIALHPATFTHAPTGPILSTLGLKVSELGSLTGAAGYSTLQGGQAGRDHAGDAGGKGGGGGTDGGTNDGGSADGGTGQGDSGGLTTTGSGSSEDTELQGGMGQQSADGTTINVPKPDGGKSKFQGRPWSKAEAR